MTAIVHGPRSSSWWMLPFTAEPWRRTAFVALAAPAAVIAVKDGGRYQQRLVRRLTGRAVPARRFRGLLRLPFDLAALGVAGYGWLLVALNIAYPVRPLIGMDGDYAHSWGGPTLAGAWALHAIAGGLTSLFAMPWILRGLTAAQARLLGR